MDKPDGGEISFDGTDITKLNNDRMAVFRRKECGFVFQQIYLIDKMNLMDNVITAGVLTSKDREDIRNRADEPTGALNSANSAAVLDVFTSLHGRGQSIVMVTHDKKSALRGNRIIYIKDGKIFGE